MEECKSDNMIAGANSGIGFALGSAEVCNCWNNYNFDIQINKSMRNQCQIFRIMLTLTSHQLLFVFDNLSNQCKHGAHMVTLISIRTNVQDVQGNHF
ncbi:CLUMA_CG011212, isoform A [Clunio marinus]|uniref:CLUMA_CG011212, isoform A n=1 Tax=Clunio marinus TaxID=568069 RepID=A0A1J1IE54_9DIPT|nr:CLUMA_CG011212, isoform A [Clunio marinus]